MNSLIHVHLLTIIQGKVIIHHILYSAFYYSVIFRHESSLYSPFEVMFGRKPILPVDIDEDLMAKSYCTDADTTEKTMEVLTNNRIKMWKVYV